MIRGLLDTFVAMPELRRRQVHVVAVACALFLVHATFISTWQIEDAAITFAYARNAAIGEGFVANPGGTWVQGFSNPTWTLFLTLTTLLGLPVFAMSKLAGVGSGLLTLPLAWLWARRLTSTPDASLWPAMAPLLLAFSGPFVVWTASGLENGFFGLFLTAGVLRLLHEGDRPAAPWSAVPLALLALTRPEAPVYVATIAVLLGPRAFLQGGVRWALGFVLGVAAPVAGWLLWCEWAFGWPLPNTYYAKDPSDRAFPLQWKHRTWSYLRQWSLSSTHVFLLPLFVYGQTGLTGRRARLGTFVLLAGLVVTLPGLSWPRLLLPIPDEPKEMMYLRIPVYALGALAVVLAGTGRDRADERRTAAFLALCTLAFSVLSGGDWMRGFRWFSFSSVPLAVLAAEGAGQVAPLLARAARTPGWLRPVERSLTLLLAPLLIAGVGLTIDTLTHPDTAPFNVRRRALYHQGIADRLHLDRVTHMEIDMGGNMFWSGFELYDIAGLVDVPIGHHHHETAFIDQYVGREARPDFIHIHGGWERKSKVVNRPWFHSGWTPVPGYAHSPRVWHVGTSVRQDLFTTRDDVVEDGADERTARFDGVVLRWLRTPAAEVAPGGELFVDIGLGITYASPEVRALLVISGPEGRRVVADLPPAYDWIPVKDWRLRRVYQGRHSIALPADLPHGDYTLGLAIVTPTGVIAAAEPSTPPVLLEGEVHWEAAVHVVSPEAARERADTALAEALTAAEAGSCEDASTAWGRARRHLRRDDPWQRPARRALETALATCWAVRAEPPMEPNTALDDPPRQAALWIQEARRLDHHAPEVVRVSTVLGDRWEAEGSIAWAQGDTDGAWRGWRDALMADPGRSGLRRQLESVRATRLKLP
ncbi:MAG: hypothetical protein H6736_08520 [Alphaproteobacteria bacterium]|nr:hypothetical protein [Alphaproteobacteria bacterium]